MIISTQFYTKYRSHIYTGKVRIGVRGRCWITVQYQITTVDPPFEKFEC